MDTRWRIVNDVPREELGPGGIFVPSRVITWEHLNTGRTGELIIPVRSYSAEYVATAVSEAVRAVAAVADLTGE